jgi:hypothetical protein
MNRFSHLVPVNMNSLQQIATAAPCNGVNDQEARDAVVLAGTSSVFVPPVRDAVRWQRSCLIMV